MNRYQITHSGKSVLLYANTKQEIRDKYSDLVDFGSEITLSPYPRELFDKLTSLPVIHRDKAGREYREINIGYNYITYRIGKDSKNGQYYDMVQYRTNGGKLVEPCLWSICTVQEFIDMYFKIIPEKKSGYVLSIKEVKKICGKTILSYQGYSIWKDSDGYYYVGFKYDWGKKQKEEYKEMSLNRDSAVLVSFIEGILGKPKTRWFESENKWNEYWKKITSEQPAWARTLNYTILSHGYNKLPVDDRKVICRLSYMDIERGLKQRESINTLSKCWAKYNDCFIGDIENLLKKIIEKEKEAIE